MAILNILKLYLLNQCNYVDARSVGFARFGRGNASAPIHLDEVSCLGGETSLLDCGRRQQHDCSHAEDAGVYCNETCNYNICTQIMRRNKNYTCLHM